MATKTLNHHHIDANKVMPSPRTELGRLRERARVLGVGAWKTLPAEDLDFWIRQWEAANREGRRS